MGRITSLATYEYPVRQDEPRACCQKCSMPTEIPKALAHWMSVYISYYSSVYLFLRLLRDTHTWNLVHTAYVYSTQSRATDYSLYEVRILVHEHTTVK